MKIYRGWMTRNSRIVVAFCISMWIIFGPLYLLSGHSLLAKLKSFDSLYVTVMFGSITVVWVITNALQGQKALALASQGADTRRDSSRIEALKLMINNGPFHTVVNELHRQHLGNIRLKNDALEKSINEFYTLLRATLNEFENLEASESRLLIEKYFKRYFADDAMEGAFKVAKASVPLSDATLQKDYQRLILRAF